MFRSPTNGLQKKVCVWCTSQTDSDDKKWGQARGGDGKGKVSNILQWRDDVHFPLSFFFFLAASIAGASHNSQDVEENVDDVGVEVEGSKDVLLWAQRQLLVAQEKLSVNGQKLQRRGVFFFNEFLQLHDNHLWIGKVYGSAETLFDFLWSGTGCTVGFLRASETYAGEEQRPQGGIDNVQDLVTDEDAEDGEEQQDDQAHKQHSPAGSEVILALQWERQGEAELPHVFKLENILMCLHRLLYFWLNDFFLIKTNH